MVVCKYFLNGNCKFGSNCRNEHPGAGLANQNRFGALSGGSGGGRFGGGGNNEGRQEGWRISAEDVRNDMTEGKGRPKWILTAYGPGRTPPASLLEANELSPEEVRARFYELASQGKQAEADQEAIALWNKAVQDMAQIANNASNVVKFMEEADKKHPNRYDFLKMDGTKTRDQFAQEFANNAPSSTPFGQSPTPNPFAKPAASTFGQPSQPSMFGAAGAPAAGSAFGKPAFGQSGFGSGATQNATGSPFGQAAASSPFGQASSNSEFGKPAFGSPGFGQPSQPTSTFGQPSQPTSTFGQPSQPTSTFGQPSQPTTSAFGQPAFGSSGFGANAPKNPFGPASAASGFGQASQPKSTFGQPSQPTSTFGQPSQPTSTFGQPSQPSSTFGQPTQPTSTFGQPTTAFGKPGFGSPPSTFGQPSQPASALGQAQATQSSPSPFGQAAAATTTTTASPFGQQPSFGQASAPAPANPFGTRPAATTEAQPQPNDLAMDTATPAPSRPASRANPFDAAQPAQPTQQPTPATSVQPAAAAKPIINTSTTPHPLTGRPPHAVHYTQTLPLQPTQKNASGQVTTYRGQRVDYVDGVPCYRRPDGKGLEKIWFPDAGATPDVVALNREDKIADTQGQLEEYTDDIRDRYKYLFEEGRFRDGKIPLVPPLREWSVYDF
ncbi:Nucleoporin AMO1 [Exophiala dermatitidis]